MANRKRSIGKERATFKLSGGRTQNPVGSATFFGKSYKKALSAGRRFLKNIAAGFYDEDGVFHPIRASYDYSSSRAGESRGRTKKRAGRKKKARRR